MKMKKYDMRFGLFRNLIFKINLVFTMKDY